MTWIIERMDNQKPIDLVDSSKVDSILLKAMKELNRYGYKIRRWDDENSLIEIPL